VPVPPPCPKEKTKSEPEADLVWRGIEKSTPKARDFRPRAPKYNADGSIDNPRDLGGLSFFDGRQNMWNATLDAQSRGFRTKVWRAGFTEVELRAAGFSVDYDGGKVDPWSGELLPKGHVSVKRIGAQEWNDWLHAQANTPDDMYSQMLADMAKQPGRVEMNVAP
jgi:hypothetical protein